MSDKKIYSILGDSISTYGGYTPLAYDFYDRYTGAEAGLRSVEDTWWMQVIRAADGILGYNNSISGSTVTGDVSLSGTSETRLRSLADNGTPDVILLYMGGNDWAYSVLPEEFEDAYLRYASSKVTRPRSQGNAYRVRGTKEPFYTLNIICGVIPVDKLRVISKGYGVTITEYLNAVLLYALLQKQKAEKPFHERPVTLAMPVNLRSFFPSKTLRNFISMVYPSIDPRMGDFTFEEILQHVHHYMRYYINPKFLNADIMTNASVQQNPLIRIVPLFIKDFTVRKFYASVQDGQSSAGLTNVGLTKLPKEMQPFVERFDVLMGQPFSARTNCAIISYQNVLTVNFTSSIKETDIERYFFRKLVQDGIPVKIETNRKMED
jgi:hypothetical protein